MRDSSKQGQQQPKNQATSALHYFALPGILVDDSVVICCATIRQGHPVSALTIVPLLVVVQSRAGSIPERHNLKALHFLQVLQPPPLLCLAALRLQVLRVLPLRNSPRDYLPTHPAAVAGRLQNYRHWLAAHLAAHLQR